MADLPNPRFGRLISRLREYDSPFQDVVERQQPSERFTEYLTQVINLDQYTDLCEVIRRYSLRSDADPPMGPGAVVVLGNRGTGKTHLVHRLALERIGLMIAPPRFDEARGFVEQLVGQLTQTLIESQQSDDFALGRLTQWFTRRVLVEAISSMPALDWLGYVERPGLMRILGAMILPRLFGPADVEPRRRALLAALDDPALQTIQEVCRAEGLPEDVLQGIARAHVDLTEQGAGTEHDLRRALYAELIDYAFTQDDRPLYAFLQVGFAEIPTAQHVSREDLCIQLFGSLVTLFRMTERPIYVVYDALETFFGATGEAGARTFFRGLAAAVDDARLMLPFLLFAERSFYLTTLSRATDQYVQQRLEQGVSFRRSTTMSRVELSLKNVDQIRELVVRRMRRLLVTSLDGPVDADLSLGPFTEQHIREAALQSDGTTLYPLRNIIQRLDERYRALVFGHDMPMPTQSQAATEVAPRPKPSPLAGLWSDYVRAASGRVERTPLHHLTESLLAGTEAWLQHLTAHHQRIGANPDKVVDAKLARFGTHPQYGRHVLMAFGDGRKVALSFLLGWGNGMPNDLEEKLALLQAQPEARMRIVWPRERGAARDPEAALPPTSQKVWRRIVRGGVRDRVQLAPVSPGELIPLLACERFGKSALEIVADVQRAEIDRLVVDKTVALGVLVRPLGPSPSERAS